MYREAGIGLNACGMADVHLRQGNIDQALAELHRALRIVREFPRMMAANRILTRTMAGLAAAYAAQGERTRAERLLNEALSHLEKTFSNPGGFIHGVELRGLPLCGRRANSVEQPGLSARPAHKSS